MARIELRDATIRLKDGLSGSAETDAVLTAEDTSIAIDEVSLNTDVTDLVPIGARFVIDGDDTIYTVIGRTPEDEGPTTVIEFAPAAVEGAGDETEITFLPQQIDIKIGEGNLTWTENKEYEYLRDRGDLDTVREMDQQPLELSLEFVYEHVTTGTSEPITPVDAVKKRGAASEWVSSSDDPCEPYAVDLEVLHCVPCGPFEDELIVFPDFRYDSLEFDLQEATISVSGSCNAVEPIVERGLFDECPGR